jgi:hypothetical protein
MSLLHRSLIGAAAVVLVFVSCKNGNDAVGPQQSGTSSATAFTPSGPFNTQGTTTSKLLGRATYTDPDDQTFKVMRKTGDWSVDIKSKPGMDVAVQTIDFPAGAQSGWHSHPGPVFIQVTKGTLTFYMSDDPSCTGMTRTAGQGYLDVGDHAHIARNETGDLAQTVVVYFAPPGVASFKIDEPQPDNCPLVP